MLIIPALYVFPLAALFVILLGIMIYYKEIQKAAEEEDIRRILAVYFEQNVTTEKFEEFDGERWIILND